MHEALYLWGSFGHNNIVYIILDYLDIHGLSAVFLSVSLYKY